MKQTNNPTNQDPENDFQKVFKVGSVEVNMLTDVIDKSRQLISNILRVPTNTLILNFEIFTRHPFGGSLREREAQPFFNALLSVSKFIYLLYKLVQNNQNAKKFSDQIRRVLFDDWDNCTNCAELQHIMKAAFGIVSEDEELLDSSFQPKYISFLADIFLLQSTFCSTVFFQNLLTAIGEIFVIIPVTKYQNRINAFRDNERNSNGNDEHATDFQSFLRLVGNISRLRTGREKNDDFAYVFHHEGNMFIHYATDFLSKSLFVTFIDTLAALTKNTEIADEFYKRLNESLSDIINLRHIVEVYSGYAEDLKNNEVNKDKLDYYDAISLEAICHLLSGFFKYSKAIRDDILDDVSGRYDPTHTGFIPTLFKLLIEPIPASLKAAIYDTLSEITIEKARAEDIWQQLEGNHILTESDVTNGDNGIVLDINTVEGKAKSYPLMRSFIRFLAKFLDSTPSIKVLEIGNRYFKVYHKFLMEQGLLKLRTRIFFHFHEKWSILSKICQAWTNLILYSRKVESEEVKSCLMYTALCDSRFINELIALINEEDIPEQSLFCIFRLLLLIIEEEPEFLTKMNSSDRIFYTPLTKRFSWSPDALVKLIQCVASKDYDLQLVTLNFAQHLAKDSPDITQIVFSRPQARTISSFRNVINLDDKEFEEDGEGERNVRNTLLEMLISLGSSSYFVRYVCNFTMDTPETIYTSTLDKGILPEILRKMKETEAPKNYPIFAANSLKLLLMICDNRLTSKPLLNFLRTSSQSFFDEQLRMLQDQSCSLTAIGCFLQLLAREAIDSQRDSYSKTTLNPFLILMEPNGFREQSRRRIVLFDEFIDRIGDKEEDECVSRGISEASDAYIESTSAVKKMKENQGKWSSIWCQFLIHLYEKMSTLTNIESLNYLSRATSFIANFLFLEKTLGDIDRDERIKIFNAACKALMQMDDNTYSSAPKLGVYSLLCSMKLDDLEDIYHKFEKDLIVDLSNSINGDSPISKAAVYAVAESIVQIARVEVLRDEFIVKAIDNIKSDADNSRENDIAQKVGNEYDYYVDSPGASLMISAKYSFFMKLIITKPDRYLACLIDNSLIAKISQESFWSKIRDSFFTSTQYQASETFLQVASKALYVITDFCIAASENERVKEEVLDFYLTHYKDQFTPIFYFPELMSVSSLEFLFGLTRFFIVAPESIRTRPEVNEMLEEVKMQFRDNSEKIRDKIRCCGDKSDVKLPHSVQKQVDAIIEQFKKYCC